MDAQTMAGMIIIKANHAVPYLRQEGQLPHCAIFVIDHFSIISTAPTVMVCFQ